MNNLPDIRDLEHPASRRALYEYAHGDPELATWIKANDPHYATRGKLSPFEKVVNNVIVAVCLPIGSTLEFIIGGALGKIEGESPHKRSKFGHFYDELLSNIFDPFRKKRILYDLSSVGTGTKTSPSL